MALRTVGRSLPLTALLRVPVLSTSFRDGDHRCPLERRHGGVPDFAVTPIVASTEPAHRALKPAQISSRGHIVVIDGTGVM